ncbi:MAG: ATP-dependent helicase, partial [Leptospiraceae bacterium]|nr:ATP-dependent helicase [Leptospiraceae bacterium]
RADTVIHLDPWWNPAAERQATDRAHRIGQLQKVNVYKFISQDSIEQRVLELQNKKREMYANLLESEDLTLANHIDQNDLMGLLNED